jgi:hypothetical protein
VPNAPAQRSVGQGRIIAIFESRNGRARKWARDSKAVAKRTYWAHILAGEPVSTRRDMRDSMIPKKWKPVSRLREAFESSVHSPQCFGGRRQVGQDHAQTMS